MHSGGPSLELILSYCTSFPETWWVQMAAVCLRVILRLGLGLACSVLEASAGVSKVVAAASERP